MTKNKKIGISIITLPFVLLLLNFVIFAVATNIEASTIITQRAIYRNNNYALDVSAGADNERKIEILEQIREYCIAPVNFLILGIIPAVGIGIYFLTKKENEPANTPTTNKV